MVYLEFYLKRLVRSDHVRSLADFFRRSSGFLNSEFFTVCWTCTKILENKVQLRVPVGSMEGPSRVLDHIRITFGVPRAPWYGFCPQEWLQYQRADFLLWAIWPPPLPFFRVKNFVEQKTKKRLMSLQLTCYWFWECLHACEFSPIIIFFFDAFPNLSGIEKSIVSQ